ncbi:KTSC domain-containing protein [Ramlibacter sp.]|uniref:KTSC domain-containing protein n=1 Tax=Ramlibacter sp. TaxID=1917967 RepID=UPI003D0F7EF8
MNIAITPVESNRLAGIGYDAETKTLAVKFPPNRTNPNGSTYHYSGVSPEFYAEFQAAESKGSFFEKRVRGGGFKYERQPDEQPADETAKAE